MQTVLSIVGDVFWIAALSIICGASRWAWGRVPKGARVPIQWNRGGQATLRVSKPLALLLAPIFAFILGLALKYESRAIVLDAPHAVIILGVRAVTAALLTLIHLFQIRRALLTLEQEDRIKPG